MCAWVIAGPAGLLAGVEKLAFTSILAGVAVLGLQVTPSSPAPFPHLLLLLGVSALPASPSINTVTAFHNVEFSKKRQKTLWMFPSQKVLLLIGPLQQNPSSSV